MSLLQLTIEKRKRIDCVAAAAVAAAEVGLMMMAMAGPHQLPGIDRRRTSAAAVDTRNGPLMQGESTVSDHAVRAGLDPAAFHPSSGTHRAGRRASRPSLDAIDFSISVLEDWRACAGRSARYFL